MYKARIIADPPTGGGRDMNYACDFLCTGKTTVYQYIRSGKLRTYMIGRRRLTTDEWLTELRDRLEVRAA